MAVGLIALIPLLIQAAKMAADAIPNKAERSNNQARRGLEQQLAGGGGGFTPEEYQTYFSSQMRPAQNLAGQQTKQTQAMLGGQPGGTQVSDIVNLADTQQRALQGTASTAGLNTAAANIGRRREQEGELEARTAMSGANANQRRDAIGQGVTSMAGQIPGIMQMSEMGLGPGGANQYAAQQQAMQRNYANQAGGIPGGANQGMDALMAGPEGITWGQGSPTQMMGAAPGAPGAPGAELQAAMQRAQQMFPQFFDPNWR